MEEIISYYPMSIRSAIQLNQLSSKYRGMLFDLMITIYQNMEYYNTCQLLTNLKSDTDKYTDPLYMAYVFNTYWTDEMEVCIDMLWCSMNDPQGKNQERLLRELNQRRDII